MFVDDRDQDINSLVQSINQLGQIFKQMGQLVVEQGTVLDRIDVNLETAHFESKKANI
jgi:syntaxin 16